MNYFNNFLFDFYKEYTFSLFLVNIIIYLLLLFNIFFLFFLFDIKYIKTLNDLKIVNGIQSISLFVVIILMSFAGIPPLLGFSGKFLIFLYFFKKFNFLLVILFTCLNMFLIFFYIQNFRFLTSKNINNKSFLSVDLKKNNFFISFLTFLNFLNVFGLLYLEELIIYSNYICSNCYI